MPPANGVYANIPHIFQHTWEQDSYLNSLAPVSDEEGTNQFHPYGVDHITDADLMAKTAAYVVVEDLSDTSITEQPVRQSEWPFRVRIYGSVLDAALAPQTAREKLIKLVRGKTFLTEVGGVCAWSFGGRRLFQTDRHYCAEVTITAQCRG